MIVLECGSATKGIQEAVTRRKEGGGRKIIKGEIVGGTGHTQKVD